MTISSRIFITKTSSNLDISIISCNHKHLFILLWRLWKYDKSSHDIGKILSGVHPRRIHVGDMASLDTGTCRELERVCGERGIEMVIKERSVF